MPPPLPPFAPFPFAFPFPFGTTTTRFAANARFLPTAFPGAIPRRALSAACLFALPVSAFDLACGGERDESGGESGGERNGERAGAEKAKEYVSGGKDSAT